MTGKPLDGGALPALSGAAAWLTLRRALGGQRSALGGCPRPGRHWQQTALCEAPEAPCVCAPRGVLGRKPAHQVGSAQVSSEVG